MADYIERQAVLDAIWPVDPENDGTDGCTVVTQNLILSSADIEAIVSEIPAADVLPNVHSRWITDYSTRKERISHCEKCSNRVITYGASPEELDLKFCPQCGARMDGDGNG